LSQLNETLAQTIRIEGTRIVATLVRMTGDLQIAEDAVQEATVRALDAWSKSGVPGQPRAWLVVTAKRIALDRIRREASRPVKERASMDLLHGHWSDDEDVRDDQLRLIFTCCHPALAREAQVTLALRVLCGLSADQIAAVLLSTPAAVNKRLTRTRTKIAHAGIPYRVPTAEELPERLSAVCAVLHTLYTSAHSNLRGDELSDVDACREALRLARSVHELMPDETGPMAVLALILLTEARRPARLDPHGELVVLAEQDRTRWDAAMIAEGLELLAASLRRCDYVADPYQLEAAIAAQHATAHSYDSTDWHEIVRLYDLLLSVRPTPSAQLARAVAVAEAQSPAHALDALDAIAPDQRWHAVRGELLARQGRHEDALRETEASLEHSVNEPERRYRTRRMQQWRRR